MAEIEIDIKLPSADSVNVDSPYTQQDASVTIANVVEKNVDLVQYKSTDTVLYMLGPQGPAGPIGPSGLRGPAGVPGTGITNTGELDLRYLNITGGVISNQTNIFNKIVFDPEGIKDQFFLSANYLGEAFDLVATENFNDYELIAGRNYPSISGYPYVDIVGKITMVQGQLSPTNSFHPGKKGQTTWDNNYFYICVDENYWKRYLLEEW